MAAGGACVKAYYPARVVDAVSNNRECARHIDCREAARDLCGFAATDVAEQLAGSVAGTVLSFAFHPDLTLIGYRAVRRYQLGAPGWRALHGGYTGNASWG